MQYCSPTLTLSGLELLVRRDQDRGSLAHEGWPQEIRALAILDGRSLFDADGEFRLGAVRETVGRRLHLVPRFRQVLSSSGQINIRSGAVTRWSGRAPRSAVAGSAPS